MYVRRQEQKFEVGLAAATFLRQEIARSLPLFEFHKGFPHTYVTTVYFDTVDRAFFAQAERSYDDNVKLRVKEYCYRDGAGKYLSFGHCYVELKQRLSGTVLKRRIPLLKNDLGRLLRGEDLWESVVRLNGSSENDLRSAYKDLRAFLRQFTVLSSSVVNYRRSVYQKSEDDLRITFDDQVAVYRTPAEIYADGEALTAEHLGQAVRRYDKVILEIKCPSCQYPFWLQSALKHHFSKRLSKFTTSIHFLGEADVDEPGRRLNRPAGPEDDADVVER